MLKEELLAYFEKNKGKMKSGEELADELGVSRTAIWKAINRLKEEGYDIIAIKKSGYMLSNNSDIISKFKIKQNLVQVDYEIEIYKTIDSTNQKAKELALQGQKDKAIISEEQVRGKGKEQTEYLSPKGKGIYMSIIMKPEVYYTDMPILKDEINHAIIEGIYDYTDIKVEISKQNDIVYKGEKVGGVLTEIDMEFESQKINSIVVGIGINIYGSIQDLNQQSVNVSQSISNIIGRYCNRSELIASILNKTIGIK